MRCQPKMDGYQCHRWHHCMQVTCMDLFKAQQSHLTRKSVAMLGHKASLVILAIQATHLQRGHLKKHRKLYLIKNMTQSIFLCSLQNRPRAWSYYRIPIVVWSDLPLVCQLWACQQPHQVEGWRVLGKEWGNATRFRVESRPQKSTQKSEQYEGDDVIV